MLAICPKHVIASMARSYRNKSSKSKKPMMFSHHGFSILPAHTPSTYIWGWELLT